MVIRCGVILSSVYLLLRFFLIILSYRKTVASSSQFRPAFCQLNRVFAKYVLNGVKLTEILANVLQTCQEHIALEPNVSAFHQNRQTQVVSRSIDDPTTGRTEPDRRRISV